MTDEHKDLIPTSHSEPLENQTPGFLYLFFVQVSWFVRGLVNITFLPTLIMVLGLWGYHQFLAPRLLVVDILGFDLEQRRLLVEGQIDETEALRRLEVLKGMLASYPKNTLFLRKDAVLFNGEELEIQVNQNQAPTYPGDR
ncbi:MAG: hypothetical protein A2600_09885 [Candidatus Lambdaproteobacteria bacterium RIFOXYD1_FULL_56_27]|uniref:Uncharacterized protein n=1 Tax=Candidatus Lambdaproteobacteria bacterium RIFOXYD2_FULL_56_26 TaxID=1817773 RepID=A0A1F6GU33_9PROT|nr:MAG: hypothetical protein A2557_11805 [Candidatus Lambdaproteobacteria bacterium RIFOXYD2_FULL_56_26]OGH04327.1 MAG: hypothetical protein A2426_05740 [Candidatus Lambdaproteobacteria bacterium RIFOXYC1_FULL_56_13]OGH07389.1 MAG: hypothetical protein A2600_09885 [Candidatus Lambdaproteobacteria bacterium RIFOXYD1_FULL_56_27]